MASTVAACSDAEPRSRCATPQLDQTLQHDSCVLALAVSDESIYAGTGNGQIIVWSLDTFQQTGCVQAHKRSIRCLYLSRGGNEEREPENGEDLSQDQDINQEQAGDHAQLRGSLLFSSASDSVINVWCPRTLARLYEIYSTYDSFGDLFSVAYSRQHHTVYYGAQNTTLQWVTLDDPARRSTADSSQHPDRRNHRFFDSRAVGGAATPRPVDERASMIPPAHIVVEADRRACLQYAHYGYVFCMLVTQGVTARVEPGDDVLITGGGDGTIKAWRLGGHSIDPDGIHTGLQELIVLGEDNAESVLSLAIDGSFLYSGKLGGLVELWDLDTCQRLRVIKAHEDDVVALNMAWGSLWSAGANGTASCHSTVHYGAYQDHQQVQQGQDQDRGNTDSDERDDEISSSNSSDKGKGKDSGNVSQKYQQLMQWQAHEAHILVSANADYQGRCLYMTGASDNSVAVWVVKSKPATGTPCHKTVDRDMMITSLREFVSYKTLSSRPEFAEDCRRGATFLRTLFRKLGAEVDMLTTEDHHPVVFARFAGRQPPPTQDDQGNNEKNERKRKRILFYGHYDVVPADSTKWNSDPFQLRGMDGYLYGRGVSDNKGPIMAALYAVTDLMQAKSLDSDILFLIEGEEESGSRGFRDAVRQNKDMIGHIDYILLANSYWINDETPCLTYGLRGVLHANIDIESRHHDLHSGVDGSHTINEPLTDLVRLISTLTGPGNRVQVPGFYDGVLPLTVEEEARYNDIVSVLMEQNPNGRSAANVKTSLMARWREPNLTVHRFNTSGAEGSQVISGQASAHISFRLVPAQDLRHIVESLRTYLEHEFATLESANTMNIRVDYRAAPWLGNPDNEIFRTLEQAIMHAWAPLFAGNGDDPDLKPPEKSDRSTNPSPPNGDVAASRYAIPTSVGADESPAARPRTKPKRPLYIREGGSIPAIRFLEREFDAPAAHLPCGQASDSAHLDNERLRLENLFKSREIFAWVFGRL